MRRATSDRESDGSTWVKLTTNCQLLEFCVRTKRILLKPDLKLPEERERPEDAEWNRRCTEFHCYAYAVSGKNSILRDTIPTGPGVLGGAPSIDRAYGFIMDSVEHALRKDGIFRCSPWSDDSKLPKPPKGFYLIAVVASNTYGMQGDYHFYKQDPDGSWSHKPGNLKVSRIDARGNPIVNPLQADRDYTRTILGDFRGAYNYQEFVGYFCVAESGLDLY